MPDSLLEKSAPIRADFFEKQGELLEKLAKEGQSPEALFIGCADSRVLPEKLLGADPGDLFMLRNIANIIPPYQHSDIGITAVLEYAVRHLQVPHLVICGHTDCGGIKGLDAELDAENEPALVRWIEFARPPSRKLIPPIRASSTKPTVIAPLLSGMWYCNCVTSKPIRLCWPRWRPIGWSYTAGFTTCVGDWWVIMSPGRMDLQLSKDH